MTEKWKIIPNFGKKYSISSWGRIRSNITKNILKTNLRVNGTSAYHRITLTNKEGKRKSYYIHVLVKTVFEPIPDFHLYTVDHDSGNSLDNRLVNLKYLSMSDNNKKRMKCTDSYKLFKNLFQNFGNDVMYEKLKNLKY